MKIVTKTDYTALNLIKKGKVRDVYDLDDFLLLIATDRISAYDVIMNDPVPYRGVILNKISDFWFKKTKHIVGNHLETSDINNYPAILKDYLDELEGRSMLVKKCQTVPIECVVRGYLAGSGWKEYQEKGEICGHELPEGLQEYSKLPEPIFTPSTKAEEGHDENIDFYEAVDIVGGDVANKLRDLSISLYEYGSKYLEERGIILADTKFEFGLDEKQDIILIDEVMTPDSSRFWLKDEYAPGKEQQNYDKQALRDYLSSLDWDKQPPPPKLPEEIINRTMDKYIEAYKRITGKELVIEGRR